MLITILVVVAIICGIGTTNWQANGMYHEALNGIWPDSEDE